MEGFIDETDLLSARQEDENLGLKVRLDEGPNDVDFFVKVAGTVVLRESLRSIYFTLFIANTNRDRLFQAETR